MNTILADNVRKTQGFHEAGDANETNLSTRIDAVKREVFAEYRSALGANDQLLRLALIEADALARQTEYPQLVFPLLASEKANNAARWQFHQQFRLRADYPLAA